MKQTTVLAPVIDLKRGGSSDERQITDTPPHAASGLKVCFLQWTCLLISFIKSSWNAWNVQHYQRWFEQKNVLLIVKCIATNCVAKLHFTVCNCVLTRMLCPVVSPLAMCLSHWQMSMIQCSLTTMRRWWSDTERNDSVRGSKSGKRRSKREKSTAVLIDKQKQHLGINMRSTV